MQERLQFPIEVYGAKGETRGQVNVRLWSKQQAVQRGVGFWAAMWIGGLVTLPIPLVHFVSVPACFLLGPVVGLVVYKVYNGGGDIEEGGGPCPDCGERIDLASESASWPKSLSCPHCHGQLTIRPSAVSIS